MSKNENFTKIHYFSHKALVMPLKRSAFYVKINFAIAKTKNNVLAKNINLFDCLIKIISEDLKKVEEFTTVE